jgi:hypothetical protein
MHTPSIVTLNWSLRPDVGDYNLPYHSLTIYLSHKTLAVTLWNSLVNLKKDAHRDRQSHVPRTTCGDRLQHPNSHGYSYNLKLELRRHHCKIQTFVLKQQREARQSKAGWFEKFAVCEAYLTPLSNTSLPWCNQRGTTGAQFVYSLINNFL